jgi:hypothetical protein
MTFGMMGRIITWRQVFQHGVRCLDPPDIYCDFEMVGRIVPGGVRYLETCNV